VVEVEVMAQHADLEENAHEDGGNLCFHPGTTWEYPLSRAEKLQRLIQVFEQEVDHKDEDIEILKQENEELRQALASATKGKDAAVEGEASVEATIELKNCVGSCVLRGSSQHVATVISAIQERPGPRTSHSSSGSSEEQDVLPSPIRIGESKVPRLCTDRLVSSAALGTPREASSMALGTPRVYSIKTPPATTPRLYSLTAPRDLQIVTPRVMSRVWSLVTPRAESVRPSRDSLPMRVALSKSMAIGNGSSIAERSEELRRRWSLRSRDESECDASDSDCDDATSLAPQASLAARRESTATRPPLPGLDFKILGQSAEVATPRIFSIRTPPSVTPRVGSTNRQASGRLGLMATTPRSTSGLIATTPHVDAVAAVGTVTPVRLCFAEHHECDSVCATPASVRATLGTPANVYAASGKCAGCGCEIADDVESNCGCGLSSCSAVAAALQASSAVAEALEQFRVLDEQDELEKAIALEELSEQEEEHRRDLLAFAPDATREVFGMGDARGAAALESLPEDQRESILFALQLWTAAAAALPSSEFASEELTDNSEKAVAYARLRKQAPNAARAAFREARKELRPWRRPVKKVKSVEEVGSANGSSRQAESDVRVNLSKPVADLAEIGGRAAELGRSAAQSAAESARRGLAAASGVVAWRRAAGGDSASNAAAQERTAAEAGNNPLAES